MMKNISMAVLCLCSLVTYEQCVRAIDMESRSYLDNSLDLQVDAEAEERAQSLTEETRYIGSDGEFINLAQTEGHARLRLEKIKKYNKPSEEETLVQMDPTQSLSESGIDDVTHCPVNQGEPVEVSIKQLNLDDNAYVSEMYVGNPPQKVRALFDTGSTNTWILNSKTDLSQGATKEFSYNDGASTTSQKTKQAAMIQFGSGALAGHFYTDDVRLGTCDGKKSSGQIHIKNQKFGNVEKQSTIFTGSNFEAIVGMAYPSLAEKGVKPVFDEMMGQNLLKQNLFSFYLTSKQAESMGMESDLTFGYYDKAKFKGEINWHPIDYKYMFGVRLDDIKFNGVSSGVCAGRPDGCLITFDSGTSLMSVPSFATKALIKNKIPTANFIVPCQNAAQFGDMSLVIGGKEYLVPNEEWMMPAQQVNMAQGGAHQQVKLGPLGPQLMAQTGSDMHIGAEEEHSPEHDQHLQVDADAEVDKHHKKSHLSSKDNMGCASTIMNMDLSKDMFLVGDVFMRRFYTIFDRANDRVGIAQAITNDKIKSLSQ